MEELIDGIRVSPVHVVSAPETMQGAEMLERLESVEAAALGAVVTPLEVTDQVERKARAADRVQGRRLGPRLALVLSDMIALVFCEYLALIVVA